MNTIFRLVWNAHSGGWSVAPETAKGRAKDKTVGSVLGAASLVALTLGLSAPVSPAYAACTGLNTASVTCTSPPQDTGAIDTSFAGNAAVTATNWQMNGGRFSSTASATGSTASFVGNNITLTNGIGSTGAVGVLQGVASGLGGNASIMIDTGTLQGAQGSYGVFARANNATGNASIQARNVNVSMQSTTSNSNEGVYAWVAGSGTASVQFTGGSITSAGLSPALRASSEGGNGNVNVAAQGGTIISTSGAGSHGILANASGTGASSLNSDASITTSGDGAIGLVATTVDGPINVVNSGRIQTTGTGAVGTVTARGISALSSVSGSVTVTNSGAIDTVGVNAHGILAQSGTAGGGIVSVANSGALHTRGNGAYGVNVVQRSTTSSDAIQVSNTGAITVDGGNGAVGAAAVNLGPGNATVTGNGQITMTNAASVRSFGAYARTEAGNASVDYAGTVSTQGEDASGVRAQANTTGNAAVRYTGTRVEVFGTNADAIYALSQGGSVNVTAQGELITHGNGGAGAAAYGIAALSGGGAVNVDFTGTSIDVNGSNSSAILALSNYLASPTSGAGAITVTNSGALTVRGPNSAGIVAESTSGAHTITNTGAITALGANGSGIQAASTGGSIQVTNSGAITTAGTNGNGIQATTASGAVTLDNAAAINANQGSALLTSAAGAATANLINRASGSLFGVTGAEIQSGFNTASIDNAGTIGASTDRAIKTDALTSGTLNINNTGTVTGFATLGASTNTLNNAGTWNLRNFAGGNLAVAVADFGTSGANTVNNTGTLALLGRGSAPAQSLDTTGQYLPFGSTFYQMALNSPVQGQLLGVQTFNHSGLIDLSVNPSAGDVLVISGGRTPGVNGGGVFVSNGGTVKMNTVLNEGGANSQSDILVVDSTRLGSGATGLAVANANGGGAVTAGNGIPLVEVLNKAGSAPGVFALSGRAAAGAYEYTLFQNGVDGDAADGNWYLRSTLDLPPVPPSTEQPTPPGASGGRVPNYRAEVPVDMVVPALTNRFGLAMLGTYHDRVGEDYGNSLTVPAAAQGQAMVSRGWARVFGENGDVRYDDSGLGTRFNSFVENGPSYDFKFAGFQGGIDILNEARGDGARDTAGISMGGGRIDSDVQTVLGGNAGYTYAEGATFGGYWTRKGTSGWYVDGVAQATAYSRIRATSVNGEWVDSTGWGATASIEGGYPFALGNNWAIEPQAQLAYQHTSISDTLNDRFGRINYDDTDAIYGRLGARLTKNWTMDNGRPLTAWARANVWHQFGSDAKTTFSSLSGQNPVTLQTNLGGTWAQVGLGISAQVGRSVSTFASLDYNAAVGDGKGSSVSARAGFKAVW